MKKPLLRILTIVVLATLAVLTWNLFQTTEPPQREKSNRATENESNNEQLGMCTPDLKDIQAIEIEEVAKNCIRKEKTWQQPDGRGWLFPIIAVYNNTLVQIENEFYADIENAICMWTEINHDIPDFDREIKLYATPIPESYLTLYHDATAPDGEINLLNQLNPISTIVGKGLINEICPLLYSQSIYCNEGDEDCWFMTKSARSDGENYFIAGYRNIDKLYHRREDNDPLYFVINDTLYVAEDREFAGISDGKIIVKRIRNLVEDLEKRETSTFTLEICEIDL